MNSNINIELSSRLQQKIQRLVDDGWFKSTDDLIETAARYYMERHTDEMWEGYVEHEMKAGLHEEG